MKRFRGSIYVDIYVDENIKEKVAQTQALHELYKYCDKIPNSYVGGIIRLIRGDIAGNAERLEKI